MSGIPGSSAGSGADATEVDIARRPGYRALRAVVVILGVLIVVGLGALIVGLFTRFSGHGPARDRDAPVVFTLPPGAKLMSSELSANRLIVHMRTPAGDEIDILDTDTGRLVGQVKPAVK